MNSEQGQSIRIVEADLEELYEHAPCGYVLTDPEGRITRVNETFVQLLGRPREELLGGRKFQELMTMAGRVFYDTHFGPLIRIRGFVKEIACDLVKGDGGKLPVLVNAVRVEAGRDRNVSTRFTVFDATERRQYENDLLEARRSAEHYKTIVQASADAILSFDPSLLVRTWNRGAENIFHCKASDAVGKDVLELINLGGGQDAIDSAMAELRLGKHVHFLDVIQRPGGENVDVSVNLTPLIEPPGELVGVSAIIRDITERKRMTEAQHQKELLQNLIESQEAERQRFARDLHDHLGQQLTGLRLALAGLGSSTADTDLKARVEAIKEQAVAIDQDLSFIAFELRPNVLREDGLFKALDNFVSEWSHNHGIPGQFRGTSDTGLRLTPEIEINLYRLAQESLNNILKHARASSVSVLLDDHASTIRLIVEDDGKGFDPGDIRTLIKESGHGLGVLGMRERAAVIGGTFDLESGIGTGTTVFVRAPAVYAEDR